MELVSIFQSNPLAAIWVLGPGVAPDGPNTRGRVRARDTELLWNNMAQRSTFPRSHLLILGPNSIQSLLPVTPISQAEALLESHRIEDVIQLADQQRKKVQSKLVVDPDEVHLVLSLIFVSS